MEILALLASLALGIILGVFAGLLPGVHPNTFAVLVVGGLPILLKFLSPLSLGVALIAMLISNSFISFIPSTFLGAPESETALGVLPAHKLLLQGKGYDALKLSVSGGVCAFLVSLIFIPLLFLFIIYGYPYIEKIVAPLIICFSVLFILVEKGLKKKLWALIVFLLAGCLGLLVLGILNIKEPLFPLLSGLFGTAGIIESLLGKEKIVAQKLSDRIEIFSWRRLVASIKASLSSGFMSVIPALGPAQATAIAQGFSKQKDPEEYIVIVGGINSVSCLVVLTTAYLINRARTGVIAAMMEFMSFDLRTYVILMIVSVVSILLSVCLTLLLGRWAANNICRINYRRLNILVLIFIIALALFFSGWLGFFVLMVASCIGLLAPKVGCRRIHGMACLIVPCVMYFI